ncbi:MAG TPA: bifunctional UDP-N-acetylmuramoyl-tripeptide:D-alanyl-D-alanine ligase/alanine racemase [Lacibacter sp.]|nr:bifunctional UDP-N-acetylmuramoyl-tripeptide:D-alanyl-D-alanine ligase/alanine racemase [Lacibacter sp.]
MSQYPVHTVASILHASFLQTGEEAIIEHLCIDSRKIIHPSRSLFFALQTERRDGHLFLKQSYEKGIRNFVVHRNADYSFLKESNVLLVHDTLTALQQLAAHHRSQFSIPVIGITGSNGKTIVKEWLYQLLSDAFHIVRSPKSYNSQIGVPLSVWQLQPHHTLGIFEAGISQKGEMEQLQQIIQPTIGVFTNLGNAHDEGFTNAEEKFREKMLLFPIVNSLIYSREQIGFSIKNNRELISIGHHVTDALQILELKKEGTHSFALVQWNGQVLHFQIPFIDEASVRNVCTCIAVCLHLQMAVENIRERILQLKPVSLRLEIKKGMHQCTLINDSYSADLTSFEIAMNVLMQQQQHQQKTVILSDFPVAVSQEAAVYQSIAHHINSNGIQQLITVGTVIQQHVQPLLEHTVRYHSFTGTDELIHQLPSLHFHNKAILIKGARSFGLERLMPLLELQVHQTVLEINLTAIARNIQAFRRQLQAGVKLMAMVKAFSYGSGSYEIANLLQYHGVDYLAVAFTDEGVELRKAGITLPIMVMNPEPVSFDALTDNNLEPELYSPQITQAFASYLQQEGVTHYPVHIKIDTGMHRLGFMRDELPMLIALLQKENYFTVQSVFSHLAAAEDAAEDTFTQQQATQFDEACQMIETHTGESFLRHITNTPGVIRHPHLQYDMVRVGIGMFGLVTGGNLPLEEALTLKTTIAQLKQLQPGETVGYNRKGVITKPSVIATVRIGYADGYPRNLSNGKGYMLVHGQKAPVIGTVCMDMIMLDVTGITGVTEGDEVIVFGKELSLHQVAQWSGTIAYEVMAGISQRVKRVYFEE